MKGKFDLYYQTLKHVKPTQLYHQVYYRLKNRFFDKSYTGVPHKVCQLKFKKGIIYPNSFFGQNRFLFLNLEKRFSSIDWNFSQYGKLWTYNLNYFEYLHQENLSVEEGLRLILDYISCGKDLKDGLEPYPISLRGINWVKFLAENEIQDNEINVFLYRDFLRLANNLEYHILANHILENGLSLLFGAYYFQDDRLYTKAKQILVEELEEQILVDGAHYEISPMYHQIILHRLLDSINLVQHNSWKDGELLPVFKEKAGLMLGWLNEISFQNGDIPKLNDAANGIAPSTNDLLKYADRLGLAGRKVKLSDSGYRKIDIEDFEIIMDVGQIAPSYQPAHSHADNLNFVLNYKNKPIIVDTGISTYEKNKRRQLERSSKSHNVVVVNDRNSSDVWGGFRVGKRGITRLLCDNKTVIYASHDGYKSLGNIVHREFFISNTGFVIKDQVTGDIGNRTVGHLHFHPSCSIRIYDDKVFIDKSLILKFTGSNDLREENFQYPEGFNKTVESKKVTYSFQQEIKVEFIHALNRRFFKYL